MAAVHPGGCAHRSRVDGGDTASALAAGCPVIFKVHPAHPGVSAIVGKIIEDALREEDLPVGTFSLLFDDGHLVGSHLVEHPAIKAAAFTGSLGGGSALMKLAANRPKPIPVFAEMSSVNPVFIMPGAMEASASAIATELHTSFTMGVGQFCTKPGVVFVPRGGSTDAFLEKLTALVSDGSAGTMLTAGILQSFHRGIAIVADVAEIRVAATAARSANRAEEIVFVTEARTLQEHPELLEEVFGPAVVVVECEGISEMTAVARTLAGQLTATIHAAPMDLPDAEALVSSLEGCVGRIVWNGFPTGVEVGHAMVHGGPFPASSAPGTTSVGSRAIHRFTRLICYQDVPAAMLPEALQDGNPLGIRRMIDGRLD